MQTYNELFAKQIELEVEMKTSGYDRFIETNNRAIKEGSASETAWNRRIIQEVVSPMSESIQAYLDYYSKKAGKPSRSLAFLKLLQTKEAAYVTVKIIIDNMSKKGVCIDQVCHGIANAIEDQVRFNGLSQVGGRYIETVKEKMAQNSTSSYKHKKGVLSEAESRLDCKWTSWKPNDKLQLGSLLLDMFIECVQFEGEPLLFKHVVDEGGKGVNKSKSYLELSDSAHLWIEKFKEEIGYMSPAYGPCVVRPRNWVTPTSGGFHLPEVSNTVPMVKCRKSQLKALADREMPIVYGCLNNLQGVKWQVNPFVYQTLRCVMGSAKELAVPRREPFISKDKMHPMPSVLSAAIAQAEQIAGEPLKGAQLQSVLATLDTSYSLRSALAEVKSKAGKEKRLEVFKKSKLVGIFRKWKRECSTLYTMEKTRKTKYIETVRLIAEAGKFIDYDSLHFVYSLDFRGRVNVRSSVLTPQGGDAQKAMLKLSSGARLGVEGKYWLAVQGAGVWAEGVRDFGLDTDKKADKISFDDRVKFVNSDEFTDMVRDIVADPMNHTSWVKADKPWQFLAWCKEWSDLQDWIDMGKREEDFVSSVGVAQDGSCSGIQHYSAMLRDEIGGKAVNLVPSALPQDIYEEVAKKVREEMGAETEVKLVPLAKAWLVVGITRNGTKKPVMTLPYGSSMLTCRESLQDYLNSLQEKEDKKANLEGRESNPVHPFSMEDGARLSQKDALGYATKKVWNAIGDTVIAARAGMKFVQDVTTVIAKNNERIEWSTPSGFLVHQEIFKTKRRIVKTQLLGTTYMSLSEETKEIDDRAMKSSCAPNFVHSMDASHLTRFCNRFGNLVPQDVYDADGKFSHYEYTPTEYRAYDDEIIPIIVIHDSFASLAGHTAKLRATLLKEFVDMYKENDVLATFKQENEDRTFVSVDVELPASGDLDLDGVLDSTYAFA